MQLRRKAGSTRLAFPISQFATSRTKGSQRFRHNLTIPVFFTSNLKCCLWGDVVVHWCASCSEPSGSAPILPAERLGEVFWRQIRPTDTYSLFVFIDVHCMSDFRKSPLGKLGGCKIFCVTQGNSATRFHSWNMSSYSFCSPFFECITQTFTRDTVIRCNSEVGTC